MAYPSNETENVAQDQIKAFVDRILRLKGEVREINADIREIYAEAKGTGFDKTVLGKLVNYVEKREANSAAVMESESIFDLYLTAYDSAKKGPHAHAREEADQVTTPKPSKSGTDSAKTAPAVTTPITEPQPLNPAGSDLAASPANDDGQVADIPEAKASEDDGVTEQDIELPADSVTGDVSRLAAGRTADASGDEIPALNAEQQGGEQPESVTGGESAATKSLYAPKGEIVWEGAPPEGVIRHEYSQAFGEAGQDIAVIEDDMAKAASAPIVKIGNVILDGWARYLKARELGIEYPVEQYAGTDSLMDCIKWNTGGRMMTSEQSFRIAQRLAKAEPKRKAEIYAAFELGMALA